MNPHRTNHKVATVSDRDTGCLRVYTMAKVGMRMLRHVRVNLVRISSVERLGATYPGITTPKG